MNMKSRLTILLLQFIIIFISFSQYNTSPEYTNQDIFNLIHEQEENTDIGIWALIIAKEFDNSVDVGRYLGKLDAMASEIRKMLAGRTGDMDAFLATRMFLYEAGDWNGHRPFSYDLDDPLGEILERQLLSHYLDTRMGNCVSMPTLFLALMERVAPDVPFAGVSAPLHLFTRLRDRQTGDVWNVETTNGGNPARNRWYIDKLNIPQKAVEQGTYLRDLSKKEYISLLLGTLISKERQTGNYEQALRYADLSLELYPESVNGLVSKGALLAEIGHRRSLDRHITVEEMEHYRDTSERYIVRARSLGWKPETAAEREAYLRAVEEAAVNQ